MKYIITTETSNGSMVRKWHAAKRADAAKRVAIDMTYDAIAAQGGLDTRWGHNAMDNARSLDVSIKGGVWVINIKDYIVKVVAEDEA